MPKVDPVILQLRADIADYNSRLSAAQRLTDQKLDAIERRAAQMGKGVNQSFLLSTAAMTAFAASAATIAAGKVFLGIADQAKQLSAQLKLATENFGSFGKAQADVFRISQDTRTELDATTKLYAAFARNANDLGISQEQVSRMTQTVAESFKISGAGASESANAIRQLVQAFQSGVLRGDEFNSVMENAPRLAKLMADSLGVPVGSLRAMAEEGKLTADKLVKAFSDTRFTDELDRQFKEIPVTFDDAMVRVKNAAIETFGAFDRGGQFSQAIANFVSDGAEGFGDMGGSAEAAGRRMSSEFSGVIAVLAELNWWANQVTGALQRMSGMSPQAFGNATDMIRTAAFRAIPGVGSLMQVREGSTYQGASQQRQAQLTLGALNRSLANSGIGKINSAALGALGARQQAMRNKWGGVFGVGAGGARPAVAAPKGGGGRRAGGGRAAKSPLDPEAFADAEAKLNDQILALKTDEARTLEAKATAEMARLAAALDVQLAEINGNEKFTADQKAILAGRANIVNALEVAKVVQERDNEIAKRSAEERAKMAERESAQRSLEIDALQAQAEIADTAKDRREIEQRILELQQEEEKARLEAMIAAGQIADASKARAALEAKQAADRTGLGRSQQGPLAAYARSLNSQDIGTLVEQYAVDELQSVRDSLHQSISDFIGTKDPLINGLINILIEQVIIRPLANALSKVQIGGGGGGGGGVFGAILGGITSIFGPGTFGGGPNPDGTISLKSSLKGRASGGFVAPGELYRVNEGASPGRVEAFMSRDGGKIIPLGQMNSTVGGPQQQSGAIATVRLELSGDIDARIEQVSGPVAVQVVRASAPSIINASARETMARARRPKI